MAEGDIGSEGYLPTLNSDISEMLIYERTLSPSELNSVGAYLEQKWGLDTAYTSSGSSLPGEGNGAVPEPTTLVLLLFAAPLVGRRSFGRS